MDDSPIIAYNGFDLTPMESEVIDSALSRLSNIRDEVGILDVILQAERESMSPLVFWTLLGSFWMRLEAPQLIRARLEDAIVARFVEADDRRRWDARGWFMRPQSLEYFRFLPDPCPVWRGCLAGCGEEGFSWSLCREVGVAYAAYAAQGLERIQRDTTTGTPILIEGRVHTRDLIGLISDGRVGEVVAIPKSVEVVAKTEIDANAVTAQLPRVDVFAWLQAWHTGAAYVPTLEEPVEWFPSRPAGPSSDPACPAGPSDP